MLANVAKTTKIRLSVAAIQMHVSAHKAALVETAVKIQIAVNVTANQNTLYCLVRVFYPSLVTLFVLTA